MGCHFFSRGSSQPRNRTQVSCTARQILYPLSHQGSPSWCIDWLQSHDYKLEGTNNLQSERFQTHEMKLIRISFFVNIYAHTHTHTHGFPSDTEVKNLPTMQETWIPSLGWEDPLEKEMATHSSTLAWKIPWTEEPGRLYSMGSQKGQMWLSN